MRLPRDCKTYQLPSWTPSWIYQILSDALAASLGYYKDDICNSRISKISILHANPWSLLFSRENILFVINCHFGGHFCLNSYFIFIFLLWAKCLQLDSNVIANNWRKKWVWDIFPYHTIFYFIIGRHLGRHLEYIELLNDARLASQGFFKDNICTTRIHKEKKYNQVPGPPKIRPKSAGLQGLKQFRSKLFTRVISRRR